MKLRSNPETRYRRRDADLPISDTINLDVESNPNRNGLELKTVEVLDVSDSTWFYRLVAPIFGFALFFIASCLYNFPAAPINDINCLDTDDLELPDALGLVLEQYVILFCACSFIVVVFASVCLAVRIKAPSLYPPRNRWLRTALTWTPLLQELMWTFLLLSLIVGVGGFDWYTFDSRTAHFYSYKIKLQNQRSC